MYVLSEGKGRMSESSVHNIQRTYLPKWVLDLNVLLVQWRHGRRRQVESKDVKSLPFQERSGRGAEEAKLELANTLIFLRKLDGLLDGLRERVTLSTKSLEEGALPAFGLRTLILAMLDDARLHLVLYDVEEGRCSRCKLAGNDEREVVRDIVCTMVLANLKHYVRR